MNNEEVQSSSSKSKVSDTAVDVFGAVLALFAFCGYVYFVKGMADLTEEQKWGFGIGALFVGGWLFIGASILVEKAMKFLVAFFLIAGAAANVFPLFWLATNIPFEEKSAGQWLGALAVMFGADLLFFLYIYPLSRLTGISFDRWE